MWLNNSNFTNCALKNTMSQLCTLFNNLSQLDKSENPFRLEVMKTAMSTILFFVTRARELDLYGEIKLNNEDLLVIRALLTVSSEFISDQTGLEILLTCTKEMLIFAKDPAKHCINSDDFSVVAMTIDPRQFEVNMVTTSNVPHLNQLK